MSFLSLLLLLLLQDGERCQFDLWRGEATGGADRPASGVRAEKGENGGRSLSKLSDNDVSNFKLAKKRMFSIGGAKCKSELMMRNITLTDKRKLTWQHSLLWLHVLHTYFSYFNFNDSLPKVCSTHINLKCEGGVGVLPRFVLLPFPTSGTLRRSRHRRLSFRRIESFREGQCAKADSKFEAYLVNFMQ